MTQVEKNTSSQPNNSQATNNDDAVFSVETRIKALEVLAKEHGGLLTAVIGPIQGAIGWIVNANNILPSNAAAIIAARTKYNNTMNEAANDSIIPKEELKEELKKAA
ncbi:MAG: hypothetical protein PHY14_01855 [Candidatus Gracilibacteria bacterium]|nr:hypothetical protein [Candidatus Gracilibacteria bacterium]